MRSSRREFLFNTSLLTASMFLGSGCCRFRQILGHPCPWKDLQREWWRDRQSKRDKQRADERRSGTRPNIKLPTPLLYIDRVQSSRGWSGEQMRRIPFNVEGEIAFVIENRGNAASWCCYTELYEGPFAHYGLAYSELTMRDRQIVSVVPGGNREVVLKWKATREPGGIIVRCYDPAQDPGLLVVDQYDRKGSGGVWERWWEHA